MLDDVNGCDAVEAIIGKRIWEFVQIDQNVGLARRIAVDANRSGLLANSATDVERQYRHVRRHAGGVSIIRAGVRFSGNSRQMRFGFAALGCLHPKSTLPHWRSRAPLNT